MGPEIGGFLVNISLLESKNTKKIYKHLRDPFPICIILYGLVRKVLIKCFIYFAAKSDGRERLTVTDTKPVIMTTTDLTNNNNNINNNVSHLNNGLLSHAQEDVHQDQQHQDAIINSVDVSGSDGDEDENDGTAQSLAEILDPELQPEPPIPNNPESQTIYREHRHMAKEYLSVDTNLYYAQDFKEKLIVQMDRAEREQKQELLRKINHKVRSEEGVFR